MKLNTLEFALMNNPVRAASQRRIETPLLLGSHASLVGKRVLEIGCGRGVGIEILLAQDAAHVTGFDLDPNMARLAQARLAQCGDRAQVFVGSADAIAAPDDSVDAVVDYGVIHHIPDWPQTLHEIARVLKPGGTFYFEDLLKGLIASLPMRALFDHPQATQFTAPEFRAALADAGLHIQQWRQIGSLGVIGQATKQR
jgi:ubiquinone/menaquinone biosynthesis C-methylase UbiE